MFCKRWWGVRFGRKLGKLNDEIEVLMEKINILMSIKTHDNTMKTHEIIIRKLCNSKNKEAEAENKKAKTQIEESEIVATTPLGDIVIESQKVLLVKVNESKALLAVARNALLADARKGGRKIKEKVELCLSFLFLLQGYLE